MRFATTKAPQIPHLPPTGCVIKVLRQKYRNFSNIHEESVTGYGDYYLFPPTCDDYLRHSHSKFQEWFLYWVSKIQTVAFDVTSYISIIKIKSRASNQLTLCQSYVQLLRLRTFYYFACVPHRRPRVSAIFFNRSPSYQFSYRTSAASICRFPAISRRHVGYHTLTRCTTHPNTQFHKLTGTKSLQKATI